MPNTQDFRDAKQALDIAQNHFDNADTEFVDSAIYALRAAEARFDAVVVALKGGVRSARSNQAVLQRMSA